MYTVSPTTSPSLNPTTSPTESDTAAASESQITSNTLVMVIVIVLVVIVCCLAMTLVVVLNRSKKSKSPSPSELPVTSGVHGPVPSESHRNSNAKSVDVQMQNVTMNTIKEGVTAAGDDAETADTL